MANHKKRFCVRGHDTNIVGRNSQYCCRQCKRLFDRQRYREGTKWSQKPENKEAVSVMYQRYNATLKGILRRKIAKTNEVRKETQWLLDT